MWTAIVLYICVTQVLTETNFQRLINERETLLKSEFKMMLGGDIVLSDSEQQANDVIMKLKRQELEFGFDNPQYFNYSKHFFEYKNDLNKSELFQIIKQMPKGAVLHVHDTSILNADYVVSLTYWDDLYVCFQEEDVDFLFSKEKPAGKCSTQWQLMKEARYSSGDVKKFDAQLKKHFSLVIDNPMKVYDNINAVWSKFQQYFISTTALLFYKPIWEQYFYDVLKAFREDNVMFIEIRSVLSPLYDLDGNVYDVIDTAQSYKKVLDRFLKDYPDFFGAKLIYAPIRSVDVKTVKEYIKNAKSLKKHLPDFLAGFDLVGQEDLGAPTKEFLFEFSEVADELDFFFHAGETNWYGTSSDENLVDAIVLNTKRIGHAYALVKHPILLEEVKKRGIALEVNVISNVVLKLVEDVRNHPLATFLALDLPVVISSDDPGLWDAEPVSHDFYVAFMGVASKHADLRVLKKLALNSLYYSTYKNKDKIVHEFDIRWAKFVHNVARNKIHFDTKLM